jgi:hypothetical protein
MDATRLPTTRLHLSVFDNAWDNQPKPRDSTVAGLVRALTSFPVFAVDDKRALPAWSPARFRPGATRKAGAVEEVSCLVLDFDAGEPDEALAAWADHLVVLHTTWSHAPEAPRFRLVLPLARPVSLSAWARAWGWAAERAPGADPACKDPSRLYFRPARPRPDAPHLAEVRLGAPLDILALLPEPPPAAPASRSHLHQLAVPARLRDSAVRGRLMTDPASRERAALEAGGTITGNEGARRAAGIRCPACGRPSVWYYLAPTRLRRARCNHRQTCGWIGGVDELLAGMAA